MISSFTDVLQSEVLSAYHENYPNAMLIAMEYEQNTGDYQ